jgi:hypothetical protein
MSRENGGASELVRERERERARERKKEREREREVFYISKKTNNN